MVRIAFDELYAIFLFLTCLPRLHDSCQSTSLVESWLLPCTDHELFQILEFETIPFLDLSTTIWTLLRVVWRAVYSGHMLRDERGLFLWWLRGNWRRRIVLLLLLLAHRALLELLGLLLGLSRLLRLDRRAGGLLRDPDALLTDMLAMLVVLLDEGVVQ